MLEHSTQATRATYWRKQIEAWHASNLSQHDFCKRRSLSYSQFQYWRRKLRQTSAAGDGAIRRSGFVAVQPQRMEETAELTVVLPNGVELRGVHDGNLALVERLVGLAS